MIVSKASRNNIDVIDLKDSCFLSGEARIGPKHNVLVPYFKHVLLVAELRPSFEKGSTFPGVRAEVHDWVIKGLGRPVSAVSVRLGI